MNGIFFRKFREKMIKAVEKPMMERMLHTKRVLFVDVMNLMKGMMSENAKMIIRERLNIVFLPLKLTHNVHV